MGLTVDGGEAQHLIGPDWDSVHLDGLPQPWQLARVALHASASEGGPVTGPALEVEAVQDCASTNLRRRHVGTALPDGTTQIVVDIDADEVAQAVDLALVVTRGLPDEHGIQRRRLVATGGPIRVVLQGSRAPSPPGAPPIATSWIDFDADEAPSLVRGRSHSLCAVDLSGPHPVLLLNDAVPGFRKVLEAEHARDERKRQQDVYGAVVARRTLEAMLRALVPQVTAEDDEMTTPDDRTSQELCSAIAGHMPDVQDVDAFYRRMHAAEHGSDDERAEFWAAVDLALDDLVSLPAATAKALEAVRLG